jgi:Family of unknown function (DUF6152)
LIAGYRHHDPEASMQRRLLLAGATLAAFPPAWAHHGWSSFDLARPLYLEGRVARVSWRNPHAELDLEVRSDLKLPADLSSRVLPAQTAPVDGAQLLKTAQLPTRKDKLWHVELAPLTRMDAWRVAPVTTGQTLALLGYTFASEKGDPVLRVEYLFVDGKAYGLRSSPA